MTLIKSPYYLSLNTEGVLPLNEFFSSNARIFVVADTNTSVHCLPLIQKSIPVKEVFIIEAGEQFKTFETCTQLWHKFLAAGISKSDLVIGLGGGCVTDITGFACSVFKRGIPFVFFPTTLLGMTDAAIGGKNGVDFEGFKNMVGTINEPENIFVYPDFLSSLSQREIKSGYAETLKHALIASFDFWKILPDEFPASNNLELIQQSALIKTSIVSHDVYEKGGRKLLNFGHTVGHAIESWYLLNHVNVLHGEAVAAGMCIEALLSVESGLSVADAHTIIAKLRRVFGDALPTVPGGNELMRFIEADKKNMGGELRFSLLAEIGEGVHDVGVRHEQVLSAIELFRSM
jgi:3-dehydroquinate synthase